MSQDEALADDPMAWSVSNREISYHGETFDIIREDVILPDGTNATAEYLNERPGVVILPLTSAGEVVTVEEWRQPVGRINRGLPAGRTEPEDHDLVAAAHRELREETGFVADTIEALAMFEPANGLADLQHHYFLATGCRRDGPPDHDADETIRVRTADYDELVQAALSGELADGRSVLGLLFHYANLE